MKQIGIFARKTSGVIWSVLLLFFFHSVFVWSLSLGQNDQAWPGRTPSTLAEAAADWMPSMPSQTKCPSSRERWAPGRAGAEAH